VSTFEIASHCGEYCEVRTEYARFFGRLLRLTGELFELETFDRRGRAVAVFKAGEVQSIATLRLPHF
jgi:hypothetical protein